MLTIPVYYDFSSTLCYVAHRVMQRLASDLDTLEIELEWRPLDLTRITGWKRGAVMDQARRDEVIATARALQAPARMPAHWLDSRPAHAIALALGGGDKESAWRERVWSAVFEEGRDIGSADELAAIAADLGLDAEHLASSRHLDRLEALTNAAREAGVQGVPTFMLGEWPMGGIQEDDTMRALLSRYVRKLNRDAPLH